MGEAEGLTQRRFAELLGEAMAKLGVRAVALARDLGVHAVTITHYRDPNYRYGPPAPKKRRQMERELHLPEGYLDGTVPVDFSRLYRPGFQGSGSKVREPATRVFPSGADRGEDGTVEPLSKWQSDPEWAEQQFRGILRDWQRTVRGMSGTPDLTADEVKQVRLTLIDMARSSARRAGRAVPSWLQAVENDVIAGIFE